MKKAILILSAVIFSACSSPENCFKSSGEATTKEIDVSETPFTKIEINEGISLVIKQGDDYSVSIHSGKHIIDDVETKITDGKITFTQDSGCNFTRAYNETVVYITAPQIEEIYSNGNGEVRSDGVLSYSTLRLFSMDFFGGVGTGDFHIDVDNTQLVVESNHVSGFYINGHTDQLLLNFYNGVGRFEGAGLLAEGIIVFQRGSNDMTVHPIQTLDGNIYSTGNVISVSHPINEPTVVAHYTGRLIFQD
ncbi:head GIN domain-containing protein [Flavobacterium silvaticum]|uniref:DUF2807 domain-containing protein n=1 Tax=Flavobacterium silvaticum TaxID=1852020 RepID=A0A972JGU0_9FLAO|nr:head GIN domain-containing protein [Flavobacterium silvaticum]NMH27240.1 DUF2807 domain-containing protein [Flavobacterium silvaticum]